MPIYEYQCQACQKVFEKVESITSNETTCTCPECQGLAHRIISNTSFVLKGEGWYVSEYGYRKGIKEDPASSDSASSTNNSSSSSSHNSTSSANSSEAKVEAKTAKAEAKSSSSESKSNTSSSATKATNSESATVSKTESKKASNSSSAGAA